MVEYIEREAAIKAACDAVWYGGGVTSVTEAINQVPAADVVPAREMEMLRAEIERLKAEVERLHKENFWLTRGGDEK